MTKVGIIYKATSPSGKSYIGQTVSSLFKRKNRHYAFATRKGSSGYHHKIARAIRKYGDNIKWVVLCYDIPINQLSSVERWCIATYDTFNEGYNSTRGGEGTSGFKHSEETRKKISESLKGHGHTKESREKMSKSHKRKKLSAEHRRKIGEAGKGRVDSKEAREKRSKTNSGKKNSDFIMNVEIAEKIRKEYFIGEYSQKELAKKYKCSSNMVSKIVNNLRYNKE